MGVSVMMDPVHPGYKELLGTFLFYYIEDYIKNKHPQETEA
jgi:hypothetical protein